MENKIFLEELKFGMGDGNLHYYFYNWKSPDIPPEKVWRGWRRGKGRSKEGGRKVEEEVEDGEEVKEEGGEEEEEERKG